MRIIIIDDDPLVCQSLKTIIEAGSKQGSGEEIEVITMGENGEEAVAFYEKERPDIILLDIRMDKMDGLEAGKVILEKDPEAKILYLTTFLDGDYIVEALRIGAKGYLMKSGYESIVTALYAIQEGQRVFGDEIIEKIPGMIKQEKTKTIPELTKREMDLVERVAEGMNNKEIAEELFLSEGTVRNYLSVILEKLQLRDRTQLAIFYYKNQ
ncbi:response regulator [Gallicola sp. Sow4_E12]|uniref:response regulator n=1 Tax=Gallicola sp. Sow4_E12 TaxID=3438785 RepID=UPI003F9174EA